MPFNSYAYVRCERAAGTDDGDATSGSWELRTLNTTVQAATWVGLAANVLTLAKGFKYLLRAYAPTYDVGVHQARLNDTTATVTYPGSSMMATSSYSGMNRSEVVAILDLTAEVVDHAVQLETQVTVDNAGDGHGIAADFGETEIYSEVHMWRFG